MLPFQLSDDCLAGLDLYIKFIHMFCYGPGYTSDSNGDYDICLHMTSTIAWHSFQIRIETIVITFGGI